MHIDNHTTSKVLQSNAATASPCFTHKHLPPAQLEEKSWDFAV